MRVAAFALVLACVWLPSHSASALEMTCKVEAIGERVGPDEHFTIYCEGVDFAAQIPRNDPARAARWLGMAMAALLSGRPLYLDTGPGCADSSVGQCTLVGLALNGRWSRRN